MKILFGKNLINLIWKVTFNCYKNHYYLRPCSSVVEQYPEKVCVVKCDSTKATINNFYTSKYNL